MRYLLLIVLVMPFVGCNEIQDRPASAGSFVETGMLSQALNVCADGETVEGIDVSHWQGEIDWDAVAGAGIKFAVIRVSDGTRTLDRHFARNWAEAQRVGMIRGIYQYFRSGQDVEEQARILLDRMGMLGPGLMPPVIDLEDLDGGNNAELQAAAFQWIRLIE
jgi:lysozyme